MTERAALERAVLDAVRLWQADCQSLDNFERLLEAADRLVAFEAAHPDVSLPARPAGPAPDAPLSASPGPADSEGTGAAVIQGRSGAQPADPDTAVTGTLLFTAGPFPDAPLSASPGPADSTTDRKEPAA